MNGVITYSDVQEAKCKEFEILQDKEDNYTVRGELEKILESMKKIQKIGANTTRQKLTDISDKMYDFERDVLLGLAATVDVEDVTNKELEDACNAVSGMENRVNRGAEALERAMQMRNCGIPKHKHDIEIIKAIIGEK